MGCSLSLKNTDQASQNIFKVFTVDKTEKDRNSGKLEVTAWEGQRTGRLATLSIPRLRIRCDLFSFESGRRCPTGPKIYAFRCQQDESLFNLLHNYITLAGHVDQTCRMLGQRERLHQTPVRPDANNDNFLSLGGVAGTPQNDHIPLSEYRNISSPVNAGFDQPNSRRITLARLPDIFAMSQLRTVDAVIHCTDLDVSGSPCDEEQDVFQEEEEEDEAAAARSAHHFHSNLASNLSVPAHNAATKRTTKGHGGLHGRSVPTNAYVNMDLTYIQLELQVFNDGADGTTCQSPTISPNSPASCHSESLHSQRDSYTTPLIGVHCEMHFINL